jgi:hypothetical protein
MRFLPGSIKFTHPPEWGDLARMNLPPRRTGARHRSNSEAPETSDSLCGLLNVAACARRAVGAQPASRRVGQS